MAQLKMFGQTHLQAYFYKDFNYESRKNQFDLEIWTLPHYKCLTLPCTSFGVKWL